nr:unnamed protein product [Digitaria exilis]
MPAPPRRPTQIRSRGDRIRPRRRRIYHSAPPPSPEPATVPRRFSAPEASAKTLEEGPAAAVLGPRGFLACPSGGGREGRRGREALARQSSVAARVTRGGGDPSVSIKEDKQGWLMRAKDPSKKLMDLGVRFIPFDQTVRETVDCFRNKGLI